MKNTYSLIGCFLLFRVSACSTAQFAPSRINHGYPTRTKPEAIELFRSSLPTKGYIEVGAASACCSMDANDLIGELKEKASQSGGDALIQLDISANGAASATVIRYE